jgi:oligo-1,6-glucosidase
MQWSAAPHGGFTTGTPWIEANPNFTSINVEASVRDGASIFAHYRKLIALRKEMPVIIEGRYDAYLEDHAQCFAYTRTLSGRKLVVIANFSGERLSIDVPEPMRGAGRSVISNYAPLDTLGTRVALQPFEAFAIEFAA